MKRLIKGQGSKLRAMEVAVKKARDQWTISLADGMQSKNLITFQNNQKSKAIHAILKAIKNHLIDKAPMRMLKSW